MESGGGVPGPAFPDDSRTGRAEPVGAGPGMRIVRVVLYLAAVNGAAAKLTLKRLHQMETTLYLLRSTLSGTS